LHDALQVAMARAPQKRCNGPRGRLLPLECYAADRSNRDGRLRRCRRCERERIAQYDAKVEAATG
jgi:hypothetical protein